MLSETEITIGGSGGQGVVLAARILGKAAVLEGKKVLQTQAYGAEARGSLATGEVIISDGKIGFPAVRKCDILVAMSQEALDTLLKDMKETGTLIVDSTNVTVIPSTKAQVFKLPITDTAKKILNDVLYANIVMLGAFTRITRLMKPASVEKSIRENVSPQTATKNLHAFKKGLQLVS